MDYSFTEEQKMIRDLARQIADEKIRPVAAEYDEKEEFPWPILKVIAESDLAGIYIEEEYGGTGGGVTELCIATEEFSKACGGMAVSYAATALGAYPIILYGSEEQKNKYLPDIAKGKKLAAFGLTEAGAGSDAGAVSTTAKKEGDYYILDGVKQWITNGGEADTYTVIAMTDKSKGSRGASAFIVEKGTPGFDFGKKEKKLGIRSSATRELVFTNCKIPKENLLGKEGLGFIVAMKTFDKSRPGIGAQAVGIAQGALDHALKYAKERIQFGKPISSFQKQWKTRRPKDNWTIIGLRREKTNASSRINKRVKKMIDAGLVDEVRSLLDEEKPLSKQARCAIGYAEIIEYLNGRMDLKDAIEKIKINTRRFAKGQRTWFKTFTNVHWLDIEDDEPSERIFNRVKAMLNHIP